MKQKHPLKHYCVILEYDYATIMLPLVILGAAIGVILNVVLPNVIIVILMMIVLVALLVITVKKIVNLCQNEHRLRKA